jgi:hypothetical protein
MRDSRTRRVFDSLVGRIDQARVHCDLFVTVESGPYFVQLMPNHRTLYAEVVSNHYLKETDRLSVEQELRLLERGWTAPYLLCHPDCRSDFHPNFSRTWSAAVQSRRVALHLLWALLVATANEGEGAAAVVITSDLRATEPSSGAGPRH